MTHFYCSDQEDCRLPFLKISFPVAELLKFKDLQNDRKNSKDVWVKSIKINKICDIMSWTSRWSEFINKL